MRRTLVSVACLLIVGAAPALGGTDPWDASWYVNGDLNYGQWTSDPPAITGDNVTTFAPNDARLGANVGNNGTTSGGMHWSYDDDGPYHGGSNTRALLNVDINVAPGQYYFEVDMDVLTYWNPVQQPWGHGQEWYIGDAAAMDYGSWAGDGAPSGPWAGGNWGNNNGTKLGSQWNGTSGSPEAYNGQWIHKNFTAEIEGSDIITTTGTVIFRALGRYTIVNAAGEITSFAMDDLTITLTPVGGGDPIVYSDAFLPEPTAALLLGLAAPLLIRRRRG